MTMVEEGAGELRSWLGTAWHGKFERLARTFCENIMNDISKILLKFA